MRVDQITIKPYEGNMGMQKGAPVTIEGVTIWPAYGWYAEVLLTGLTGPEFGRLEDAPHEGICLRLPALTGVYDPREESTIVHFHDSAVVKEYITKGALTDPQVALELARQIEVLIRQWLQPE